MPAVRFQVGRKVHASALWQLEALFGLQAVQRRRHASTEQLSLGNPMEPLKGLVHGIRLGLSKCLHLVHGIRLGTRGLGSSVCKPPLPPSKPPPCADRGRWPEDFSDRSFPFARRGPVRRLGYGQRGSSAAQK